MTGPVKQILIDAFLQAKVQPAALGALPIARCRGTDRSMWEPVADFRLARSNGERFTFLKVSQGRWTDPAFENLYTAAGEAGQLRGGFLLYNPDVDPVVQADIYCDKLAGRPLEVGTWFDLERYRSGKYHTFQAWYTCLERIKSRRPQDRIAIYSTYYYITEEIFKLLPPWKPGNMKRLEYLKQYDLALAGYLAEKLLKIPKPWSWWDYWQDSEDGPGSIWGAYEMQGTRKVPTKCDTDFFRGTEAELRELHRLPPAGDEPGPVDPPQPHPVFLSVTIQASPRLNVRGGPAESFPVVARLAWGAQVDITETSIDAEGNTWGRLARDPGRYICMIYHGFTYAE